MEKMEQVERLAQAMRNAPEGSIEKWAYARLLGEAMASVKPLKLEELEGGKENG